jgi:hypothetical protein
MVVHRDNKLSPVKDFIINVQPFVKGNDVAEEKYENGELVGWVIVSRSNYVAEMLKKYGRGRN